MGTTVLKLSDATSEPSDGSVGKAGSEVATAA
jgi:hypothetical protein